MEERYVSCDAVDEWRDELRDVPHAFAHTVECCRAARETTGWPTYLYSCRTSDAHVVCPVGEREHKGYVDLVTPFQFSGFTGTTACYGFQDRWQAFARNRGAVTGYHALHPAFSSREFYAPEHCYIENNLYLLDLRRSEQELLASFDRSRRRQLRGYETRFEQVILDRTALTEFLVETYPSFVERVQASPASRLHPSTLRSFAAMPNIEFVGAGTDGRIEAVYVFGFTPFVGDCLLNVASPEGRQHATLLLWYGMLALKARGVPILNLGGGVRPGDRVAAAKERFRAERVPFRSVKQVYEPEVYERLCREAGVDHRDRTGYFPAYRVPQKLI